MIIADFASTDDDADDVNVLLDGVIDDDCFATWEAICVLERGGAFGSSFANLASFWTHTHCMSKIEKKL